MVSHFKMRAGKRTPLLLRLAIVALALAACGGEAPIVRSPRSGSNPASTAAEAPAFVNEVQDFTAQDITGKTVHLSDYLGKQVVLLNFWGTFCEPCLAEFPHLRRMYTANKAKGFVVLAVSMDGPDTIANVPAFAKRNGLEFPVLLDDDSHVAAIFNPKKSAPLSILIDRTGKVRRTHEGYNPGDETVLQQEVEALLR
jgi:peroxiredoxin